MSEIPLDRDDPLSAARGIYRALIPSFILWAIIIGLFIALSGWY